MIGIYKNQQDLSTAAADLFIATAKDAITKRGSFTVALTGGNSPALLYALLGDSPYKEEVEWDKVFVYWGDERWVPLDDEKSNARMAFDTLLNHVPIPHDHIFPMWEEGESPQLYAIKYEQLLDLHVTAERFDLILLGMGDDGHTASLFPGTAVLQENKKRVAAYYLAAQEMYRITLTAPMINLARTIIIMLYGLNKANALYEVLEGERNTEKYPAQLIQPIDGEVHWLVDEAAAKKLALGK
ncbi:6-phosphogluconolactonase, eukaryotic type [Arcticibacter svalbardensis MN12-7]|uniref:6-phosphogluconolactonase n=1 Tax=Arcticibacter svalbardensis MN12-7 TaxID=1150600 RepID=R9GXE0_9SPHI|nr:6-phosphogluconolactonase [Arcticibacter svalbardensis]EOR93624.1 6-phosphogluconolactonase, eukaryotic type [Arcticibacter svalbardensis MN12-7]